MSELCHACVRLLRLHVSITGRPEFNRSLSRHITLDQDKLAQHVALHKVVSRLSEREVNKDVSRLVLAAGEP